MDRVAHVPAWLAKSPKDTLILIKQKLHHIFMMHYFYIYIYITANKHSLLSAARFQNWPIHNLLCSLSNAAVLPENAEDVLNPQKLSAICTCKHWSYLVHEEGAPFHRVSALNSSLYLHAVLSDAQGAHARTDITDTHTNTRPFPYTNRYAVHSAQLFTSQLSYTLTRHWNMMCTQAQIRTNVYKQIHTHTQGIERAADGPDDPGTNTIRRT